MDPDLIKLKLCLCAEELKGQVSALAQVPGLYSQGDFQKLVKMMETDAARYKVFAQEMFGQEEV